MANKAQTEALTRSTSTQRASEQKKKTGCGVDSKRFIQHKTNY